MIAASNSAFVGFSPTTFVILLAVTLCGNVVIEVGVTSLLVSPVPAVASAVTVRFPFTEFAGNTQVFPRFSIPFAVQPAAFLTVIVLTFVSLVGTLKITSSASCGIFTTVSPFCLLVYVNAAGSFALIINLTSTPSLILLDASVPSFS